MSTPVTAIVLTKNEEANLPDCLASLRWADEVLVVDSFSTDATVEIAQRVARASSSIPSSTMLPNITSPRPRHTTIGFYSWTPMNVSHLSWPMRLFS